MSGGKHITPVVIANWKMQLGVRDTAVRLAILRAKLKNFGHQVKVVVCPSYMSLMEAKKMLRNSKIQLGAQDVFWDEKGAYTGEVSPLTLLEAGVGYVLLGHSERRQYLGETDVMVARKIISALSHNLMPVICVGETAHERNDGLQETVVRRQLSNALRSAPPPSLNRTVYLAYEPIWAIGSGEPAPADLADDMRVFIRQTLIDRYSLPLVTRCFRILYGGSVNADNVCDYIRPGGYDGALVGTASLEPSNFYTILTTIRKKFN